MADFPSAPSIWLDCSVEYFDYANARFVSLGHAGGYLNIAGNASVDNYRPNINGGVMLLNNTTFNGGHVLRHSLNTVPQFGLTSFTCCIAFAPSASFSNYPVTYGTFGKNTLGASFFVGTDTGGNPYTRVSFGNYSYTMYSSTFVPQLNYFYIVVFTNSWEYGQSRIKIWQASTGSNIINYKLNSNLVNLSGAVTQYNDTAYLTLGNSSGNVTSGSNMGMYLGNWIWWDHGMTEAQMNNVAAAILPKYSQTPIVPTGYLAGSGGSTVDCTIIRWEGTNTTSGSPGGSNTIWEMVIFVDGYVELRLSTVFTDDSGISGVYTSSGSGVSASWNSTYNGYCFVFDASAVSSSTSISTGYLYRNGSLTTQTSYPTLSGPNYSISGAPSGFTSAVSNSVDDGSVAISLTGTTTIFGTTYTTAYVGSNGYVTFGGGSSQYSGLSTSSPALNKIFVDAADRSYQAVSYKYDSL